MAVRAPTGVGNAADNGPTAPSFAKVHNRPKGDQVKKLERTHTGKVEERIDDAKYMYRAFWI